ncbi:MAG: hypothetical protein QM817_05170 [Archangium sp.]
MASTTLVTTEQLVIDGTNGVTRASREQFPEASYSLGAFVVAALIAAVLVRKAPKWLPVLLFVPAAFGLFHVFVARGDAPLHRGAVATQVSTSLDVLKDRAAWPVQSVALLREDDDVTFPLSRYAVPARPPVNATAVQLEVRGTQLPLHCRDEAQRVICGEGE